MQAHSKQEMMWEIAPRQRDIEKKGTLILNRVLPYEKSQAAKNNVSQARLGMSIPEDVAVEWLT